MRGRPWPVATASDDASTVAAEPSQKLTGAAILVFPALTSLQVAPQAKEAPKNNSQE
jgi:hypothetical protein